MKKIIIALLAGIILICFNSCMANEEAENMIDALKISTWVLDKSLEGTGYWVESTTHLGGYWVLYESDKQIPHDDVFKFEALELNEVRVMAPMNYIDMNNLNILFEFDGIVEVETEIPNDERIKLAYSTKESSIVGFDWVTVGNSIRAVAPIYVNVCPSEDKVVTPYTKTDREYYLNVKTYTLDGTQVISAQLRLVAIKEEHSPEEYDPLFHSAEGEWTRFLSIELVSYEYSDVYKLS